MITTSRKLEAVRLAGLIAADRRVDLGRYSETEAWEAVRCYTDLVYSELSAQQRHAQAERVWGILDQQRQIQELDLEPLILRMIFEAYSDEEIPRDLNTALVYDHFWESRVRMDRVADVQLGFVRERLCCFLARCMAMRAPQGQSDVLSLSEAEALWQQEFAGSGLDMETLFGLVSSGVLNSAQAGDAVRFFHAACPDCHCIWR